MAGTGNPDNLRRAAQAKRQAATRGPKQGLRKLIKTGQPITFEAVAQAGGVSKDFLYPSPLRSRIEGLRGRTDAVPVPPPAAVTPAASDTSSVIRTLTAQLAELRRGPPSRSGRAAPSPWPPHTASSWRCAAGSPRPPDRRVRPRRLP